MTGDGANGHLDVRSNSLRGDEPDARLSWHHLRECRCVYCREARLQLLLDEAEPEKSKRC